MTRTNVIHEDELGVDPNGRPRLLACSQDVRVCFS